MTAAEGPPLILLVPEQATFQMEHALAATPCLGGTIRAQVLSFRRLAHRVLLETGGAARVPIGELGKRMVLRELLTRHRDKLRVFGKSAGRGGFADTLARAVSEMKMYRIGPLDLAVAREALPAGPGLLQDKLADMELLYRALEEYLAGRYTDPDDYLNYLAERLAGSPTVRGAEVWVDGFTGFTPQEFNVLNKILHTAGQVHVTLCLDPENLGETLAEEEVFYPTWETYREICKLAQEGRVPIGQPLLLKGDGPEGGALPRFRWNAALAHIEGNYFLYPAPAFDGAAEGLKVAAGANRRAEVEAVAREIIRLCRDGGYRWRDTAVMLRDLESYHELISTVFGDNGIPFFIDRKRPVLHHPLIELIRSALETVHKDWAYDPVFRYLKTDLTPVSRDEIDRLENYVLAHGIRGKRWTDEGDWTYRRRYTLGEDTEVTGAEAEELAKINAVRRQAVAALAGFAAKAGSAGNVRELTAALYNLLEELAAADRLTAWAVAAEAAGQVEKAREHLQVWGSVISLLDEVVEALGDEALPPDTYLAVLEAGFESLRLGLIPPGLDQVLVGSLDRSRNPDVRAVFILGAGDGILPARPAEDGVFNDAEREKLASAGVALAPGGRRQAFDEQYLVYTALTRSSHYLWISYPLADDEGRATAPSQVVARIKELFPELKGQIYQVEPTGSGDAGGADDLEFVVHPGRTLVYLAGRLREIKAGRRTGAVWWDVYNWFAGDNNRRQTAAKVLKGLFHVNVEKPVPYRINRELYGPSIRASVSRIEKYMACPFAHFANYGLKLRERAHFQLAAPDMGEFFHAALKGFGDRLRERALDWGALSPEECRQFGGEVVAALAPQLQSEILLSTARYRYLTGKLRRTVDRAALMLAEHARRSKFRPVGLEIGFGPGETLPPVAVPLADGLELQLAGRIDRVDLAETESGAYLRVIDYKSSDNRIELGDIYHGLRLQLLTYMHVALTHSDKICGRQGLPAGILYFTVKDPLVRSRGPLAAEDVEKEIYKALKMKGLFLADPDVFRLMDNRLEGGKSELFPVHIKSDGEFSQRSPVITAEGFNLLRRHLSNVFTEAGEEILAGRVDIAPYRRNKQAACGYCPFKPVCQFDHLLPENKFRLLTGPAPDRVWGLLAGNIAGTSLAGQNAAPGGMMRNERQ
jgi:ATP-dependent helicase/nuclease subunit B